MEALVDALGNAYEELVTAVNGVLEAKGASGGKKTPGTDAALESFKDRLELFKVACDHAEEFVQYAKHRIAWERHLEEAMGAAAAAAAAAAAPGEPGQDAGHGLPPIG